MGHTDELQQHLHYISPIMRIWMDRSTKADAVGGSAPYLMWSSALMHCQCAYGNSRLIIDELRSSDVELQKFLDV